MTDPGAPPEDVRCSVDGVTKVGTVELCRPPHNFLDIELLRGVTAALHSLADDPACHVAVVCAEGRSFCAGRDFRAARKLGDDPRSVYAEANRLLDADIPWIAAVQGAAVGAGLGLALCADFRVAGPRASFAANFVSHGLHHGFGLTVLLPRIVGLQRATTMLYSGRRFDAEESAAMGLVDRLADEADLRPAATELAAGLASSPPAALSAIRTTMRLGLAEQFRAATEREAAQQAELAEHPGASRTPMG